MASPRLRSVESLNLPARFLRGLAAAAVAVVGLTAPVFAHAELVSASPAVGSQIQDSPGVVVLNFSEDIDTSGTNVISVMGPMGDELAVGATRVSGPVAQVDVNTFTDEGTYVVSYRVISADGHEVKNAYAFEWYRDPAATPGDGTSPTPSLMSKPQIPLTDVSATPAPQVGAQGTQANSFSTQVTRWVILGVFVAALLAASKALRTYRRKRLRPDAPDEV